VKDFKEGKRRGPLGDGGGHVAAATAIDGAIIAVGGSGAAAASPPSPLSPKWRLVVLLFKERGIV